MLHASCRISPVQKGLSRIVDKIALRAAVHRDILGMAGWVANQAFEYWFPMPAKYDRGKDRDEATPLVILGGERKEIVPRFETCEDHDSLINEDDDSVIKEDVSRALKDFLPHLFEGKYEKGREPEMEWVSLHVASFDEINKYTILSRSQE